MVIAFLTLRLDRFDLHSETTRPKKQKGKAQEGLQPVSPTIPGSSALQTGDPPPYPDRNPQGPRITARRWGRSDKPRLSESRGFLDSISKALSRSSSTTSHNSSTSSGGISSISTALTTPSEAPLEGGKASAAKTSALDQPSTSQDHAIITDSNLKQDDKSQYDARKEWRSAVELHQRLATRLEKIRWVRNDKEEFEKLVSGLYEMNQMLRDMLPKLELPKPFEELRNGRQRPHLWVASTEVRKALESVNVNLRRVNKAVNSQKLKITVRLEDDHDETRRLLEQNAPFFNRLNLRNDSLAFRLATYFEQPTQPNKTSQIEALICSSIYGVSNSEIDNLPQKLQVIKSSLVENEENDEQFTEVGQVTADSQNAWSVYREVTTTESAWLSEQTLEDFVEHTNFTPKQRIYLAAKIALAHLHFAAVNRGFACRQLKNYRYFRQSEDRPLDWTIPFVSIPWLDYGFGSPVVNTGKIRLNAPSQEASTKIDPAIELGVLLYQIAGSTKMQYSNATELKAASEEAAGSLNKVLGLCGLPVMEIIETCFKPCLADDRISRGQDAAFVIIEEVAAALIYQAEELKK